MINGNARNDGIHFGSNKYSVYFEMGKDSKYEVHISENVSNKVKTVGSIKKFLYKVPFIRGIIAQIAVNRAFGFMIFALFILDILNMIGFEESYGKHDEFDLIKIFVMILVIVITSVYIFKKVLFNLKKTLQFHGAEHKVINTYLKNEDLSFENVKKASRVSRWCGTELAVFLTIFFTIVSLFVHYESMIFLISFSISYEVFNLKNGDKLPVLAVLFKLGYFCQERFFTKEPTDEQLTASLDSFKLLLKAEHGDFKV